MPGPQSPGPPAKPLKAKELLRHGGVGTQFDSPFGLTRLTTINQTGSRNMEG
jgi:hypothetical protein